MALFLRILKAELIKTKRTYGVLISVAIPILIIGLQFLIFFVKHEYFAKMGMNPWKIFGSNLFNLYGMLVLPMYIVLIAYLINFTEHRANSWKSLFALPIPKFQLYAGKIVILLGWMLLFSLMTFLLSLACGQLLSLVRPDIGFQDYTMIKLLGITQLKLFLSGIGILSIQFFFSIYWKDFIRPVGIGFGLTIVGFVLRLWGHSYLFPFSHPILISDDFISMEYSLFNKAVIISLLCGVVFFSIGFYLVSKKEIL